MTTADPPSTLPALFAAMVASRGTNPAIVTPEGALTYAELDERSARLARGLIAAGAGKGTRIALLAPDGILWLTTFLAVLRIGGLLTLVSTLSTPSELAHILRNSDVQFVIAARRHLRHDYGETLGATMASGRPPYLREMWFDDAEGLDWAQPLDSLLGGGEAVAPDLLPQVEQQVAPGDDAVIVYTSGSTALPKAVVHRQWTVVRHPPELARLFLIQPRDRMMPLLPAFWLGGLAMVMQVLSQGATLIYAGSPETEAVLDALVGFEANRVNGWGDGLTRLRQAATARGIDVDGIVGLGPFRDAAGELIPPPLQSNMLGMSETFAPHSAEPLNVRLPEDKPGASGRSVNGYERRVVDPESGREMPAGEVGELQLRGPALMTGLYKVPREKVFTPDGFYPTGDLVRIDPDGYLTFVARGNDMIKTRAANVSRLEVEAALRELPGVALPFVTGLADEEFGQIVAAAVVPEPDVALSAEGLRAALRARLSSYKVPRKIVFVREDQIPRTATGKLKLHELAEFIAAQPAEE